MTAPPAPDTAAVDRALAGRAVTSATMLTGLLTAGMLDTAGQVDRLPMLLWPDVPEDVLAEIWGRALAVGFLAGRITGAPRWRPEELDAAQRALADAGYTAMARQVAVTASHGRGAHPADTDPPARGDHP
ncbi:hypothetical protein [Streptomyces sp. NPDC017529]|uniref:hypothetical protein n=1 Tax=Streptomyces sp. NPDC017529 TaxID=3365000 RepID=UPI0037A2135E